MEDNVKYDALSQRVGTLEGNVTEIFTRLNIVERTSDVVIEKLDNIKSSQKDLKDDVKALAIKIEERMKRPEMRLDATKTAIITAIITAIVAFLVGKLVGK